MLWETDAVGRTLSNANKGDPQHQLEVQQRCKERLLAYGVTNALSDRFDIYKKDLKANYSQGNNKYKGTIVKSYQMALDVMRIY